MVLQVLLVPLSMLQISRQTARLTARTSMEYLSHVVSLNPGSIYGHLQLQWVQQTLTQVRVPALGPTLHGRTASLPLWDSTTSVTQAILVQDMMPHSMLVTPSGTGRGVQPQAPAASSTALHGSADSCQYQPHRTLKSGCALTILLEKR